MQISLARRDLAEFDASAFNTKEERDMLYSISKLDVTFNRLTLVRGMQCLSNLTALDISNNRVRSLAGLPLKIRRIVAAHNDLKTLDGLAPLAQLEYLDISHNDLGTLFGLPATQALRVVNASHNKLTTLKGVEIAAAVHELRLDHNVLRRVEEIQPLRNLRALRFLDLTANPVCATARNVAAIRLAVPKITAIEGLPLHDQLAARDANGSHVDTGLVQSQFFTTLKDSATIRRENPSSSFASGPRARSASAERRGVGDTSVGAVPSGRGSRPVSPIQKRSASANTTPNTSMFNTTHGPSAPNGINNSHHSHAHSQQQHQPRGPSDAPGLGGPAAPPMTPHEALLRDLESSRARAMQRSSNANSSQKGTSTAAAAGRVVSAASPGALVHASSVNASSASNASTTHKGRSRSADALRRGTVQSAAASPVDRRREQTVRIGHDLMRSFSGRGSQEMLAAAKGPIVTLAEASKAASVRGTAEEALVNASQSAVEVRRHHEQRIEQLEKELAFAVRKLADKTNECDAAQLQVRQLKETIDRQARINAVLAETNRSLSSAHGGGGSESHLLATALREPPGRRERSHSNTVSPKRLGDVHTHDRRSAPPTDDDAQRTARGPGHSPPRSVSGRAISGLDMSSVVVGSETSPKRHAAPSPTRTAAEIARQHQNVPSHRGGSAEASDPLSSSKASGLRHSQAAAGRRATSREPQHASRDRTLEPSDYHVTAAPLMMTVNATASASPQQRLSAHVDPHHRGHPAATLGAAHHRQGGGGGSQQQPSHASSRHSFDRVDVSPHRHPQQISNSRNVSFGGSQFYSPPSYM